MAVRRLTNVCCRERRSDDELVLGGEIKECESVIASLLCALFHFIDSYHRHNSRKLLPTLWAVLDTCDERGRERSGGLGGKIRMENVCMTAREGEMDWKEWRETELYTALGSLILLTLYAGVRLLWKPPLHPLYQGFHGDGGLRSSLWGCLGHTPSLTVGLPRGCSGYCRGHPVTHTSCSHGNRLLWPAVRLPWRQPTGR